MSDFIGFCAGVGALFAVAMIILFGSVKAYEQFVCKPACEAYGKVSGQKTFFSLGTNCLVERNGEWVDYNVAVGNKQEITVKSK